MKNHFPLVLICFFLAFIKPAAAMQEADSVRNFHVGLVYPISSNGTKAAEYTNRFSLHAISGISRNETGMALAGAATIVTGNASGTQISGVFNYTGNNSKGAQIAGFANMTRNRADGIQIAGFMNKTDTAQTQLAGFANLTQQAEGAQIAGFSNINTGNIKGVQIAGFLNNAREVNTQISGFMNIAQKVKGVQIAGLINIAEESDYPIGIINIIKNGEKSLGLSIDETNTALTVFRSGGRVLYGILGIGYNFDKQSDGLYGFEGGIGANLPVFNQFRIRGEVASQSLLNFKGISYNKGILRILPSLKVGNRLEIYGGPSLNMVFYESDQEYDYFSRKHLWKKYRDDNWQSVHFGYSAGIQFHL